MSREKQMNQTLPVLFAYFFSKYLSRPLTTSLIKQRSMNLPVTCMRILLKDIQIRVYELNMQFATYG